MTVDASAGVGGLAVRYDERFHVEVEAGDGAITARAVIGGLVQEWTHPTRRRSSTCTSTRCRATPGRRSSCSATSDVFRLGDSPLGATIDGNACSSAEVDGSFLSSETTESFTGRVIGVYAVTGDVSFQSWIAEGDDE